MVFRKRDYYRQPGNLVDDLILTNWKANGILGT